MLELGEYILHTTINAGQKNNNNFGQEEVNVGPVDFIYRPTRIICLGLTKKSYLFPVTLP